MAIAYLKFLYTDEIQRMIGRHFFRPSNPEIAREFPHLFPELKLVTIDDEFGGWRAAQALHFSDGGEFDGIISALRRR